MDTEPAPASPTVAILCRGDAAARRDATPQNSRFVGVFEALAAVGINARPVIYDVTFADAVRDELLTVDGILVWVDPIHQGKTRAALDPLLRGIATQGPWVSAHPDIILKMGTKDVLYGRAIWAGVAIRIATMTLKSFAPNSRRACEPRGPG